MQSHTTHDTYDAVIVGARCAGAATGMLLASAGLRVLVFDKTPYGSDTLSTHALMRPAVLLLQRWGLIEKLEHSGTPRVQRTTFCYADDSGTDEVPIDIKPRYGVDALYAPRRTALDRVLVNAARDAGAEVRHGLQMVDLDSLYRRERMRRAGPRTRRRNSGHPCGHRHRRRWPPFGRGASGGVDPLCGRSAHDAHRLWVLS